MTKVRLGTRGSRLALAQAQAVAETLRRRDSELDVELVRIQTSGDASAAPRLGPELGQSFFTKEIEEALLDGRIDVAVHSCKDLASTMPDGLVLAAVPVREDPHDVLVSTQGLRLSELPCGAAVGTSSVRRRHSLTLARPDLDIRNLRGNVPTRLDAVEEGRIDAIVIAAAGLHRLGLAHRITEVLAPPLMVPAAGQGALALQARVGDARMTELLGLLEHEPSRAEVDAERACMRRLAAGCQAPVGVLARAYGPVLRLEASVTTPDRAVRTVSSGGLAGADRLGERAASALLAQLGFTSLAGVPWAGPGPRASATASGGAA